MDEKEFRKTLSKAELESRAYIVTVKINDFALLEKLNTKSMELDKTWDYLINEAIRRMLNDIDFVNSLRW